MAGQLMGLRWLKAYMTCRECRVLCSASRSACMPADAMTTLGDLCRVEGGKLSTLARRASDRQCDLSAPTPEEARARRVHDLLHAQSEDLGLVAGKDGVAGRQALAASHDAVSIACNCDHRATIVVVSDG